MSHAGTDELPLLRSILQLLGPCLFLGLQGSCILVAVDIQRLKSVRKLSSIPFASLLACGYIWTEYGLLRNDWSVWVPNAVAVATAVYCMSIYYKYAQIKPSMVYACVLLLIGVGTLLGAFGQMTAIGLIGCIMSVLMSGSPLAVINTVIKEQSTASLPFWTSLVTWLNSLSWVAYGYFVARDPMILMPNTLGLLLGSVQMALFAVYGFHSESSSKINTSARGDVDESEDTRRLSREEENPYSV